MGTRVKYKGKGGKENKGEFMSLLVTVFNKFYVLNKMLNCENRVIFLPFYLMFFFLFYL